MKRERDSDGGEVYRGDIYRRLLLISRFQEEVASGEELEFVCDRFFVKIGELIPARVMALFLLNEESMEFDPFLVRPPRMRRVCTWELESQIDAGVFAWVLQNGLPVVEEPRVKGDPAWTGSLLLIPLLVGRSPVGMVEVLTEATAFELDRETVELLALLGRTGAFVIHGKLLQQKLRHTVYGLEKKVEERTVDLRRTNDELEMKTHLALEANRLKSIFLASMSHELRNPLSAIIGFGDLLLEGKTPLDGKARHYVERMSRNAMSLLELMNDILDQAKIEAGRMSVHPEETELDRVVDQVVSSVQPMIEEKPIKVIVDLDDDLPRLHIDPLRLRQIILNLMTNAAKFTNQGSIEVRATHHDELFHLQVKDTGIGIEEKDLKTIFEEFRQVDGTSGLHAGGTGLGLTITRRLVELMGGSIDVQSTPGKGSTFTITLPLVYREQE